MGKLIMSSVYGNVSDLSLDGFCLSVLLAFVLGAALANLYYATSDTATKGFAMTLAVFPPVTCVVVLLISDNFGAGLAVAGAFALIKFKSVAGTAKEIAALFISIGMGIACGSGFLLLTILFNAAVLIVFYLYSKSGIWVSKKQYSYTRMLVIEPLKKNCSRADVEALLDQFAQSKTLMGAENSYNRGRDKNVLRYTYKIVFADAAAEDNLLEALVASKYCFEISQMNLKKIEHL